MKNRDFRPISRFILQTIQDMAIVTYTMEDAYSLLNGAISNDLE